MVGKAVTCLLVALVVPLNGAYSQGKEQKKAVKEKHIAVIETTLGTFEVELFADDAPRTVANFAGLAEKKYFDGISFHRIAKGFVIQGGDPTGSGAGGKSIYGKEFEDELNPYTASYQAGYLRGAVAMANRGPNTNTSQFFVLLSDAPWLPKNYTIFGKVIKGMETVDAIGQLEIIPVSGPSDGKPKTPVLMKKVTVRKEKVAQ